jgi:hypothetical protein
MEPTNAELLDILGWLFFLLAILVVTFHLLLINKLGTIINLLKNLFEEDEHE